VKVVALDCFSGVAGDMLVGALLDLGAPLEAVRDGLSRLSLDGYEVEAREVRRGPIRALKFGLSEFIDNTRNAIFWIAGRFQDEVCARLT
jgi:uncharacterized protein (DUF111 family)